MQNFTIKTCNSELFLKLFIEYLPLNLCLTYLYYQADNLRALAERENNNTRTQHAYSAASAYSSIVQEINDGKQAADEAESSINSITNIVSILKDIILYLQS